MMRVLRGSLAILAGLVACLASGPARAGIGPETTLLVVNEQSPLSRAVANEYIRLRDLPERQVLWLADVPPRETIDVATFRDRILTPIEDHLSAMGLDEEIDLVAYSVGFPYAVDFRADLRAAGMERHRYVGTAGSLTGLTYFARRVAARDVTYLAPYANRYARRHAAPQRPPPRAPTSEELALREAARQANATDDAEAAIGALEQYVEAFPWDPGPWVDLGLLRAQIGRIPEALDALEAAADAGWSNPSLIQGDRRLRGVQAHPRWEAIARRLEEAIGRFEAARGFRGRYHWGDTLRVSPPSAVERYRLAVALGYADVRGNSVPEILHYLRRSAASDASHPDGTVYLMEHRNVRSRVRQPFFPSVIASLAERGRRAEVLSTHQSGQNGRVPAGRPDVIGVVAGTHQFNWARSGSQMLPGAIAESLTSFGADFARRGQTKLSEFLRHGAAGSSGAVREPFSIIEKFPLPQMHVFYADGVSLAEAFYLAIRSPYQLLVVGEPLARPFARLATVELEAPDPAEPWRGEVELRPSVVEAPGRPVERIELWVDGRPLGTAAPGATLRLDTTALEDGHHELRLVAVERAPIETRSHTSRRFRVDNHGAGVEIDAPAQVSYGEPVVLQGRAEGATEVEVLSHGARVVARAPVTEGRWSTSLSSEPLGPGPVALVVRAHRPDGVMARSPTVEIRIEEPTPMSPTLAAAELGEPGVRVRTLTATGVAEMVELDGLGDALPPASNREGVEAIEVETAFEVRAQGLYEMTVRTVGELRVSVNGRELADGDVPSSLGGVRLAVALAPGWHRLHLRLNAEGSVDRVPGIVLAGPEPAFALAEDRVRRPAASSVQRRR